MVQIGDFKIFIGRIKHINFRIEYNKQLQRDDLIGTIELFRCGFITGFNNNKTKNN